MSQALLVDEWQFHRAEWTRGEVIRSLTSGGTVLRPFAPTAGAGKTS